MDVCGITRPDVGWKLSAIFVVRFSVVVRGFGGGRLPGGRITLPMDDDSVHAETFERRFAWLDHAGLRVEGNLIADGDPERECRHLLIARGGFSHRDRQKSGQVAFTIGRLVAMLFDVPGVDANLIEVVGQAVFPRRKHSYIFGNLIPGNVGVGVVDLPEDVGADDF
jgi:hypothetical protein